MKEYSAYFKKDWFLGGGRGSKTRHEKHWWKAWAKDDERHGPKKIVTIVEEIFVLYDGTMAPMHYKLVGSIAFIYFCR